MAEELADMVAEIVVGMEVDEQGVDMKDIFKNVSYCPLLVVQRLEATMKN